MDVPLDQPIIRILLPLTGALTVNVRQHALLCCPSLASALSRERTKTLISWPCFHGQSRASARLCFQCTISIYQGSRTVPRVFKKKNGVCRASREQLVAPVLVARCCVTSLPGEKSLADLPVDLRSLLERSLAEISSYLLDDIDYTLGVIQTNLTVSDGSTNVTNPRIYLGACN